MCERFRKKKTPPIAWDPALQTPAVRCSICTGEKTAGLLDRRTGRFTEYGLIRDDAELEAFCERLGVEPEALKIFY